MEDVVPLATEEALSNIPEEQSSTLMIEGVLGDLALEVDIAEVRRVKKEEELSSTPRKDDGEEDDAFDEIRLMML